MSYTTKHVHNWYHQLELSAPATSDAAMVSDKPGTEGRKPLAVCRQQSIPPLLHNANYKRGTRATCARTALTDTELNTVPGITPGRARYRERK
jgi:hypothetical protein